MDDLQESGGFCLKPTPNQAAPSVADLRSFLSGADSVTIALSAWCERYRIGHGQITAEPAADVSMPLEISDGVASRLGPLRGIRRRDVILCRGAAKLCRATNWYVPARLSAPTNLALESTKMPFGQVIAASGFRRVDARGGITAGDASDRHAVLVNEALVVGQDGQALAFVKERFLGGLLIPGT
jgi:hypothetical protein